VVFASVVSTVLRFLAPGRHPEPLWGVFLQWVILPILFARSLPQYYELRENGLFLGQGWTKTLISYPSLVAVDPYCSVGSRSDRVFSMDRILIVTNGGNRYVIAVAEEKRFLAEIWKRCPRLNPATASQIATLMEKDVSP
jgi:hypothetical protein